MNGRDGSQKKTQGVFSSISHQGDESKVKLPLDFCLTWVILAIIKNQRPRTKNQITNAGEGVGKNRARIYHLWESRRVSH